MKLVDFVIILNWKYYIKCKNKIKNVFIKDVLKKYSYFNLYSVKNIFL